ncbi:MAG: MotA/TolQ/ExbB proton channel family protein [Verrucomicrobiota bacterium]|nr:MotA/TolQ/ExbB proton channel family protein [Verrucomicrobiota bacterium]
MRRLFIIPAFIASLLFTGQTAAQDNPDPAAEYKAALEEIEKDLDNELKLLAQLRLKIASERPDLSTATEKIAAELREKRRQSQLASQERDALVHSLGKLGSEVATWRDEHNYIDNLLTDFRRGLEAQLSIAGARQIRGQLLAADKGGNEGLNAQVKLLETAILRMAQSGQPRVFPGEALDSEGVAHEGKFVESGPVSWFMDNNGKLAGLVNENDQLQPQVIAGIADPADISALVEGKAASPAFDPSLGTALILDEVDTSPIEHIRKGGFWIYPILILALIATLAAVMKWLQLLRIKPIKTTLIRKVLQQVQSNQSKEALARLEKIRHPAGTVLQRAIRMGSSSADDVEEALYEEYLKVMPPLERGLPLIAIASATAPLLGLLGTVTGMIHTFSLINIFGTGDAKSLSSGIAEALVTTEFGLIVAIPALILHALLSRKVSGIRTATEMASIAYVNGLKAKADE